MATIEKCTHHATLKIKHLLQPRTNHAPLQQIFYTTAHRPCRGYCPDWHTGLLNALNVYLSHAVPLPGLLICSVLWLLGDSDAPFHCCHCSALSPDATTAAAATAAAASLAIAGLAWQEFVQRTPAPLHLCFGYHGEGCPRRGLFQGREKEDEVGRGTPDHSFSKLSLKR
eukprot:1159942-Pelagomonas_calceolata.AAC.9